MENQEAKSENSPALEPCPLERAIQIAVSAHIGQIDKAGAPYILHPLRVMGRVSTNLERIVAVLHDVVEDTTWTFDQLAEAGFGEDVLEPLRLVTKLPSDWNPRLSIDENYFEFVKRAASHPVSATVKRADILENLDLSRISNPTEKDLARLERYKKAIKLLPE